MNFDKKFDIYDENAVVQKKVAEKLLKIIDENIKDYKFKSVLEIGCGTGIFTKIFLKKYDVKYIILNDVFNTEKYLKNIKYDEFICGDMDDIKFPKSDIIVSSSVFQWTEDFEKLIKNISNSCSCLAFSIYIEENLIEIKSHFDISLKYLSLEKIEAILKNYFKTVKKDYKIYEEKFSSPIAVLKHLKNTGVTGFKKTNIEKIRSFKSDKLTYKTGFFFCTK